MYMTEDEYRGYIQSHLNFEKNLIACAHEISRISKGRDLVGEWVEEMFEWEGKLQVCFESEDGCGDMSNDCVDVPIEYIYDEEYRHYYRAVLINQRRLEEENAAKYKAEREAHTYRVIMDERAEYERLKAKFEP